MDSEEERAAYSEFLRAQKKWFTFVKCVAFQKMNKRLADLNKKYDRYAYTKSFDKVVDEKTDEKVKKLYKKLSLIFHPDKFYKTGSIFNIITNFTQSNDFESLEYIIMLAPYILKCEDEYLPYIITILEVTHTLKELADFATKNDTIVGFKPSIIEEENNRDFEGSMAYQWYMGDSKKREQFEACFLSEEELIHRLKYTDITDKEYEFYIETGNELIQRTMMERLKMQNSELRDEIQSFHT